MFARTLDRKVTYIYDGNEEVEEYEYGSVVLEKIKVKANTKNIYEIITSFYINNLDQNHLVNNNIIFNYNFEKIDC